MTPEQAASKYKWVKYNPEKKLIELFCDHHLLSSMRSCEAAFTLEHLLHIKPNYQNGDDDNDNVIGNNIANNNSSNVKSDIGVMPLPPSTEHRKPWSLEFGSYLHYCLEYFYLYHKKYNKAPELNDFLQVSRAIWEKMSMDWYANSYWDAKKYKEVNGWEGVSSLLAQYYVKYMEQRIRVIDAEITFGYDREVLIGSFYLELPDSNYIGNKVNCYLTGRIDLLIDNGNKIGPVDHKHTHRFRGDEQNKFNPHDAITGYILAVRCLIEKNYPKYFEQGHECLSAWIYHISGCTPAVNRKTNIQGQRFKITPIDKVRSQLEDFKARQLSSFKRITELLFNNKVPEWNTLACHNVFGRKCQFLNIHEAPSEEWNNVIKSHYVIGRQWDPTENTDKVNVNDFLLSKEGM